MGAVIALVQSGGVRVSETPNAVGRLYSYEKKNLE